LAGAVNVRASNFTAAAIGPINLATGEVQSNFRGMEVASVFIAALAWDRWFAAYRPWSADSLGIAGGALVGYLAITRS
jgi:hypothetical protein